jgi:hypothetical protein
VTLLAVNFGEVTLVFFFVVGVVETLAFESSDTVEDVELDNGLLVLLLQSRGSESEDEGVSLRSMTAKLFKKRLLLFVVN